MAKITIDFDTITKLAVVTVDGEALDNVTSASLYQSYDYDGDGNAWDPKKYSLSVSTRSKDKDKGIHTYTSLTASKNGLETPEQRAPKLAADVAGWISKKKTS